MGLIYKNQSKLRIELTTGQDLADVSERKIKFRKPNGETGEFPGILDADNKQAIYHEFSAGDLDQSGEWTFWAYVVFKDSRVAPGEPVTVVVGREGR